MQAFLAALDIDYSKVFCCDECQHEGATIVIDGKEMGLLRTLSRKHTWPKAPAAPVISVEWCVLFFSTNVGYVVLLQ